MSGEGSGPPRKRPPRPSRKEAEENAVRRVRVVAWVRWEGGVESRAWQRLRYFMLGWLKVCAASKCVCCLCSAFHAPALLPALPVRTPCGWILSPHLHLHLRCQPAGVDVQVMDAVIKSIEMEEMKTYTGGVACVLGRDVGDWWCPPVPKHPSSSGRAAGMGGQCKAPPGPLLQPSKSCA